MFSHNVARRSRLGTERDGGEREDVKICEKTREEGHGECEGGWGSGTQFEQKWGSSQASVSAPKTSSLMQRRVTEEIENLIKGIGRDSVEQLDKTGSARVCR